jgi:hypothetical protein
MNRTIPIGDTTYNLERVSGRKASRAMALVRQLSKSAPELQRRWAEFTTAYERDNYIEVDRAQAALRFPPRPVVDPETGEPVLGRATLEDGAPNPEAGKPLMLPSPLDRMTEEDWAQSGNVVKLRSTPSRQETVIAVLDYALEVAEESVYRLLALFTVSNADVKRVWKDGGQPAITALLDERADELLDEGYADELVALAVEVSELVDDQFRRKIREELGERVGNLLALFGIERNPTPDGATESPQTTADGAEEGSSTTSDGPSPMRLVSSSTSDESAPDGDPTTSSTNNGTSSSSSETSPRKEPATSAAPASSPRPGNEPE